MVVVTLTHPKEVAGEGDLAIVRFTGRCYGPFVVCAGPTALGNSVPVTNMLTNVVLFNDLAHVGKDGLSTGDRHACPRFKTVPEGVEASGVRANAGIFVRFPSATKGVFHFKMQ